MIQSVDSIKLLQEINRQAAKCNRSIRVLIEVHIAAESSKHGFSPNECKSMFEAEIPLRFKNLKICGLMGMATFTDKEEQIRHEFRTLRTLFESIRTLPTIDKSTFTELSTGMSDDYPLAIAEGSTMVRIGTALFGEREY
jgi:pyridoxal phosphate enzyme (YggS family)